jgi:hypothetical protein
MSEQYPDLGITQKQDGDYWDIVIPDLDCSTDYALQAAWIYSDKVLGTSEFSDRFNFRTPGPRRSCPINMVAVWNNNTADLKISWEKPFLEDNITRDDRIKLFQITLTAAGEEPIFIPFASKVGVNEYSYTLSQANNMANFGGVFQTTIVGKITSIYGDGSSNDCLFTIPVYVDPICTSATSTPTVISADSGIIVSWQDGATKIGTYRETRVYVSTTVAPYSWVLRYTGSGPASITLDTLNTVYVKLNHLSDSGCQSLDSNVVEAKAYDQVPIDNFPPDPIINPTAAWNARNLYVSFTMPAENLPSHVIVHLTSGGKTRKFEKPVSGVAASASTSVEITRNELINSFDNSPSSFSGGYVTDIDIYRNENTTQVPISNIATQVKPNPLLGKVTIISVDPSANGYIVSSNFDSTATGIKIYQSSSANGTYTEVGSSNSSPVAIYDDLNAGTEVWVKGLWTCEEGIATLSIAHSVTPIDVGALSLIENPIKIKTEGSIFAGTLDANDDPVLAKARMVINKRGLFLYDDNDANGLNPTTQIIGKWDDSNTIAPATFITQKAKIADWIISTSKIENTGNAVANVGAASGTFTGMSPSGTYSFWAGGGVPGGYSLNANEDAKFSVTKAGYVKAKDLHITGGTIKVGDNFEVDVDGLITAIDADLTGTINARSGILGSMFIGGKMIVDGAEIDVDGQLMVTVPGPTGGKVEIGKLATSIGATVGAGIQVTNTVNGIYAQLDPINGIIAKKGSIGGWTISADTINNGENIGFYNTTTSSDIAIWAGGNRTGTPGPNFSITYGGSLVAKEATIYGEIQARSGYFGLYNPASKTITSGWKINGKVLESFDSSLPAGTAPKVKLDGLEGSIIGGNIVGSNHFFTTSTNWNTIDPVSGSGNTGNVDYISSSGNFRLANGNLTYYGNEFKVTTDLVASNVFLGSGKSFSSDYLLGKNTTIPETGPGGVTKNAGSFSLGGGSIVYDSNTGIFEFGPNSKTFSQFRIKLNVKSNSDGTAGDPTVVQDADGYLTTGRSFFYAGNQYPGTATTRGGIPSVPGKEQGSTAFQNMAFSVGDIVLSRKP